MALLVILLIASTMLATGLAKAQTGAGGDADASRTVSFLVSSDGNGLASKAAMFREGNTRTVRREPSHHVVEPEIGKHRPPAALPCDCSGQHHNPPSTLKFGLGLICGGLFGSVGTLLGLGVFLKDPRMVMPTKKARTGYDAPPMPPPMQPPVEVGNAERKVLTTGGRVVTSNAGLSDSVATVAAEKSEDTSAVESLQTFWPRTTILMGLLVAQSLSSSILQDFHGVLQSHPQVVYFLTMLTGLGGNAGAQSVLLASRQITKGERVSVVEQMKVGSSMCLVLGPLAAIRALVQTGAASVALAIGVSGLVIVIIAVGLGTALPKILYLGKVDPGHAGAIVQVVMDMVGLFIICTVSVLVLEVWFPGAPGRQAF